MLGFARATSDGALSAVIWDVSVAPAWQRGGLGRALMERLTASLVQEGISTITLYAGGCALQGKGLVRGLGWRVCVRWCTPQGRQEGVQVGVALHNAPSPLTLRWRLYIALSPAPAEPTVVALLKELGYVMEPMMVCLPLLHVTDMSCASAPSPSCRAHRRSVVREAWVRGRP